LGAFLNRSGNFNQSIDRLPQSVTNIRFVADFNRSIDRLPQSVTNIAFGADFNLLPFHLPPFTYRADEVQPDNHHNSTISTRELKKAEYKNTINKYEQTECVICIERYEPDDDVYILPCHHIYHIKCFSESIKRCPMCRESF
jgi:hypothetical protein